MKIYISHSVGFDYKKELYPALEHALRSHRVTFPFRDDKVVDSKNVIAECDLVIAEVSRHSTRVGIELGWANMFQVKIMAIHKKSAKISDSIKTVTTHFVPYSNSQDLAAKVALEIQKLE